MQGYLIDESIVIQKLVECSFELAIVLTIGFFAVAIIKAICGYLLNKERIDSEDYDKYLSVADGNARPKGFSGVES